MCSWYMLFWFFVVGMGLTIGDVLLKRWMENGAQYSGSMLMMYVGALLANVLSLTLYAYQLRVTQFSVATIIPMLVNIVAVFVIGQYFFNESLSASQIVGVGLSLCAIIFLAHG